MEAYRDQYATLFNNGDRIVVLAVSVDPDTTLARWAERAHFPMLFAADTEGIVGKRYGAYQPAKHMNNRTLYVIAPDRADHLRGASVQRALLGLVRRTR